MHWACKSVPTLRHKNIVLIILFRSFGGRIINSMWTKFSGFFLFGFRFHIWRVFRHQFRELHLAVITAVMCGLVLFRFDEIHSRPYEHHVIAENIKSANLFVSHHWLPLSFAWQLFVRQNHLFHSFRMTNRPFECNIRCKKMCATNKIRWSNLCTLKYLDFLENIWCYLNWQMAKKLDGEMNKYSLEWKHWPGISKQVFTCGLSLDQVTYKNRE